jgi:flagellar biosynthesis protein FlhG
MKPTPYEVLGVDPRATQEQIDKAYRFAREMYGDSALATYSLLGPQELAEMRERVEEAYGLLRDPAQRQMHDLGDGVSGATLPLPFPQPSGGPPAEETPVEEAPPVRTGPRGTLPDPVTGKSLRQARMEAGVSLHDIAQSSKVGVRFLEYIEGDRFALLPAPVYLRSFLYEYARAIGLDPRSTAEAYMARVPRT